MGNGENTRHSLLGTVKNGWGRIECAHGKRTYRCVNCGAEITRSSEMWPGPHKCTYQFAPQNDAQRAVVDVFIRSRYGLDMTAEDIAKAFGTSAQYIRELLYKARLAAQEGEDGQ